MKCISVAKEKLNDVSSWSASINVNLIPEDVLCSGVNHVSEPSKKLLPPVQVRSKGHPPSKRKESKIEKITKKKKTKKNVL